MAYVRTGECFFQTVEIVCIDCGSEIDRMDMSELPYLLSFLNRTGQQIRCFDCEPEGASDEVPACLVLHKSKIFAE